MSKYMQRFREMKKMAAADPEVSDDLQPMMVFTRAGEDIALAVGWDLMSNESLHKHAVLAVMGMGCDKVTVMTDAYVYKGRPGVDKPPADLTGPGKLSEAFARNDPRVTESLTVTSVNFNGRSEMEHAYYFVNDAEVIWEDSDRLYHSEEGNTFGGRVFEIITGAIKPPGPDLQGITDAMSEAGMSQRERELLLDAMGIVEMSKIPGTISHLYLGGRDADEVERVKVAMDRLSAGHAEL